ncbi:MAG: hypothetical protein ACE15C_18890 [Phycisphaerae bacterium]
MSIDKLAGSMLMVNAVTVSLTCLSSRTMRSASAAIGFCLPIVSMKRSTAASTESASVSTVSRSLSSIHASISSQRRVDGVGQMVSPCERRPAQM